MVLRKCIHILRAALGDEQTIRRVLGAKLGGAKIVAAPDCDTPVEKLIEYGRRLGATATPTWFLANGERHSGALPLEEVRRLLDEASPAKR